MHLESESLTCSTVLAGVPLSVRHVNWARASLCYGLYVTLIEEPAGSLPQLMPR